MLDAVDPVPARQTQEGLGLYMSDSRQNVLAGQAATASADVQVSSSKLNINSVMLQNTHFTWLLTDRTYCQEMRKLHQQICVQL